MDNSDNNDSISSSLEGPRIIPKIFLGRAEISLLLKRFGLSLAQDAREAGGGRIANNFIVNTEESGDVIVRIYPQSYGFTKVEFEVAVLLHLSKSGLPVPSPLALRDAEGKNTLILSTDEFNVMVYRALKGNPISQSMLSTSVASACGKTLAGIIPAAKSFLPTTLRPHGDLGFIGGLLRAAKERDSNLASHSVLADMEEVLMDPALVNSLEGTSKGIVHADYFFENVLINNGEVSGVIDFGDAYYGNIVNDVVIGAMEFSVLENNQWDLGMLQAFLKPNSDWLRTEKFNGSNMRKLLLANCVRFAVYTLPFSNDSGLPIEENNYVRRFNDIKCTDLGQRIETIWDDIVSGV